MPSRSITLRQLPDLPPSVTIPWSAETVRAYRELQEAYRTAQNALNLDEPDPVRLGHYLRMARTVMVPISDALRNQQSNPLPTPFITDVGGSISALVNTLESAVNESNAAEHSKVSEVKAIKHGRTGRRGRPRKIISESFLREAFRVGRNISISRIAATLGVHRNSIKNYMKLYKIIRPPFSNIEDPLLDLTIRKFKDNHPSAGIRYIRGHLLQEGIRVQRSRIIASLARVDSVARVLLRTKPIQRREYKSARPNALWHLDGHHKLGPWGIVIHGITDGFDRVITGMNVSTINTASAVLELFVKAVENWGCPSRVRGDRGSENVDVCTWMIIRQGPNRASFMWGTSTHNTRIERLWLETGHHFARGWRAFFTRLERLHHLDRSKPNHLWLLHTLFLEDIQKDCHNFCKDWNHHPISGRGHNMSPMDLRLIGQTKYGVYDKADGIDPALLHRYYGARAIFSRPDNDGALSVPEDEDQAQCEIASIITSAQMRNIRHEAAEVAKSAVPFGSEDHEIFAEATMQAMQRGDYPAGFHLMDEYEPFESYRTGRSTKPLVIALPHDVWFPRILAWCQALDILKRFGMCREMVEAL